MRRILNVAASVGIALSLGGCAYHTFAPGPGMSAADYEPDAARCRLFARGNDPSFSFGASGSPKFVAASMAGAAVGAAIGTAVRENQNFNDCMEARGWRIADGAPPAAPVPVALQTTTPVPAVTTAAPALFATSTLAAPAPQPGRRTLGIKAGNVTDSRAYSAQLDPPRGLVVMSVMQGGAASAAGLQTGDVILSFGSTQLMTVADLQRALTTTPADTVVPVEIWRDRQKLAANLQF